MAVVGLLILSCSSNLVCSTFQDSKQANPLSTYSIVSWCSAAVASGVSLPTQSPTVTDRQFVNSSFPIVQEHFVSSTPLNLLPPSTKSILPPSYGSHGRLTTVVTGGQLGTTSGVL